MTRPKLLAINGCASEEGDVHMLLLALANFDPDLFELYAASVPRGQVYDRLKAMPHVQVMPIELGGEEAPRPSGSSRAVRMLDTASAIFRLVRFITSERIDVIYSIDRTIGAHIAQAVSRLTRRPLVLSSHYPFYASGSRLNRLVVQQATRIHVHSEYLKAHVQRYTSDSHRVIVVPNAIQLERYEPEIPRARVRCDLGVAAEAPVVVMAGRLSPFKGQDSLIEAANEILRQRPETEFVIAGHDTSEGIYTHGPQATSFRAILDELIDKYGIRDRVRLVGYYPHLPSLIAAGDVSVMASWEEPFGLVALEAMAMRKPVVATSAGGVPEFMPDGEAGYLVPPRDSHALAGALLKLLDNPQQASTMGARGRQRVEERYTARAYAAGVGRVVLDAINSRRRKLH